MCFSPYWGFARGGGGAKGLGHNLLMQFSSLLAQTWKLISFIFRPSEMIKYPCKACFRPCLGVFLLAGGGGSANLLMQFSSLYSSKMEILKLIFFTIHNDQIPYGKCVLDPHCVLVTLFGNLDRGKEAEAQPAYAIFHSRQLKNGTTGIDEPGKWEDSTALTQSTPSHDFLASNANDESFSANHFANGGSHGQDTVGPHAKPKHHGIANPAAPAARLAARNLGNCHGTGEIVPFVNGTFEWGVVITPFLSILSIVPRHCARLTHFLHPKLSTIHAVPISPQLPTLTLRCACGAQEAVPMGMFAHIATPVSSGCCQSSIIINLQ